MSDTPGLVIQGDRGIAQEPHICGFQDEQIVIPADGPTKTLTGSTVAAFL